MLTEPERTPYDLRFRLLGFPVRVHPWFWILAVLLGASSIDLGLHYLAMWVAVVFVSILVHELGHAAMYRLFGSDAGIVLYWLGGLAVPTMDVAGRGRRIIVSLAGPFAGFVLCGLIYASNVGLRWGADEDGLPNNGLESWFLYRQLIWVNLIWGLFNLLPVFPLDGGQVSREVCGMIWRGRGRRISLQISFVLALVVVAYSLLCEMDGRGGAGFTRELPWWFPRGSLYTAILFGLLAYSSYQLLQQPDWTESHWTDDRTPYDR